MALDTDFSSLWGGFTEDFNLGLGEDIDSGSVQIETIP